VKVINEICKCDPIEGVSMLGDEVKEEKHNKYSSMTYSTVSGNKGNNNN